MTGLKPGDLIDAVKRPGPWVVLAVMGEGTRYRIAQPLGGKVEGVTIGAGDALLKHRPNLLGRADLQVNGHRAEIVADDGEHVRVVLPEPRTWAGIKGVRLRYSATDLETDRGTIVLENFSTILKEVPK
jgi:hypothetical protein